MYCGLKGESNNLIAFRYHTMESGLILNGWFTWFGMNDIILYSKYNAQRGKTFQTRCTLYLFFVFRRKAARDEQNVRRKSKV